MALDAKAFLSSLVFNAVVGSVVLLLFSVLRLIPTFAKFYQSKRYVPNEERKLPNPLSDTLLGWILPLFRYSEKETIQTAGMDAVINLRLVSFGFWLFLIISILCCVIVLPINTSGGQVHYDANTNEPTTSGTQGEPEKGSANCSAESLHEAYTDMDVFSLTNVPAGSTLLWGHLVIVYVVSIVTYALLSKYHKHSVLLRFSYLASASPGAESHAVLTTDIPGIQHGTKLYRFYQLMTGTFGFCCPKGLKQRIHNTLTESTNAALGKVARSVNVVNNQGEQLLHEEHSTAVVLDPWEEVDKQLRDGKNVKEIVKNEFEGIFGDDVQQAFPICDCKKLWQLYQQLSKLQITIEDYVDECKVKLKTKKPIKNKEMKVIPKMYGQWCVDKYGSNLKCVKVDKVEFLGSYLQELFKEYKEEKQKAETAFSSSAFVTFRKRVPQAVSASAFLTHDERFWRTRQAPAPTDIIWNNLMYRLWEKNWRNLISWTLYILMIAFYAIPVAFVQALITEFFSPDNIQIEFLRNVLQGIVPGLALKIFLILVPVIIAALNRFAGTVSQSGVDFGVVRKYYYFQVLVVYLYTLGFSYLLQEFKCILKDPASLVNKLAAQVPSNATYFMTYILVLALFAKPFSFLALPQLLIAWFLSLFQNTERKKKRIWKSKDMSYGPQMPDHTIVILIGLCFCVVQPLITPVCLLYFVIVGLITRYQLLYMKGEKYQSGGLMWSVVFDQVVIGLFIMQLTMIGLLGLKRFGGYTALLVPLPVLTVLFKMNMDYLYRRPLQIMSLQDAADLDRVEQQRSEQVYVEDAYLAPCFKFSQSNVDSLLDELKDCQYMLQNEAELVDSHQINDDV
eukprot:TRINITY_DN4839_c0_g1_i1.p1 TRINITY_DN4839_c0_g1~~TRINITY_DN4839_c0_g1_i1.p1  ORF type:complete len:864 (-),score=85.35 TRINITY_DN4839_c0_g1_i1:389-2929(-)